jgi:hypothetical protein
VVRVILPSNAIAKDLIRALVIAIGAVLVSRHAGATEVRIDERGVEWELGRVLRAIGSWLDGSDLEVVDIRDGSCSYRLERSR